MGRLAQFPTFGALASVALAMVLALSLLLLSEGVGRAAKPTGDTTPPTLSTVFPANNATGVGLTINVEATFSEAMNASTINGSTFTLTSAGTTTPVAAQVSYDPAATKATLDPNADLAPGTTYTATIKGGAKGATDLAGNAIRSNNTWSFTTAAAPPAPDTTPPDTTIDSGPSATVSSTSASASFTFSSTEANSTFECSLDGAAYSGCTSPKSYSALGDGTHTFSVRAIDAARNVDPTPASRTWMIDTSTPPSSGCPTGQYLANYYNNTTLSGSAVLTRCEASINNSWGTGGPGSGVSTDNFSVRWEGTHSFEAGDYTFTATSDDGIRVWVDNELLIDQWKDQPPTTYNATRTLAAGDHQVKVEYYEKSEGATAQLSWQKTTSPPPPDSTKTVALTFDDGPQQNSTPQILDTLRAYNVKATFFVVGKQVNTTPTLAQREYAEGHSVQNHTYTHPHLTTLSETEVRSQLADTNAAIEAAGLPKPYRFRPPYGETNSTVVSVGQSLGLTQTLWDVDPNDWAGPSASTICDRVVKGVKPGSVVLLHDGSADDWVSVYNTNAALPCIINTLRQNGYRFITI